MLKLSSVIASVRNKNKKWQIIDTWLNAIHLFGSLSSQHQATLEFILRFSVDHHSFTLHITYVATAALG